MCSVTAEAHPQARFHRAIERRALWMAEDAARELPNLPLEDGLKLVHLYAERGSPKHEPAALRWLERYLTERTPRLQHFAEVTASLAKRGFESGARTKGRGGVSNSVTRPHRGSLHGGLRAASWLVDVHRDAVRVERPEAIHPPRAHTRSCLCPRPEGEEPLVHVVDAALKLEPDRDARLDGFGDRLNLDQLDLASVRRREKCTATHVHPLFPQLEADAVLVEGDRLGELRRRNDEDRQSGSHAMIVCPAANP